jgi:hypothetical protein
MAIRVLCPEGRSGRAPHALAPSPGLLAGRRLVVLDNGKPGAALLMGRIAERLAQRTGAAYGGVRRKGTAATPCEEELLAELSKHADLVMTGSAD